MTAIVTWCRVDDGFRIFGATVFELLGIFCIFPVQTTSWCWDLRWQIVLRDGRSMEQHHPIPLKIAVKCSRDLRSWVWEDVSNLKIYYLHSITCLPVLRRLWLVAASSCWHCSFPEPVRTQGPCRQRKYFITWYKNVTDITKTKWNFLKMAFYLTTFH